MGVSCFVLHRPVPADLRTEFEEKLAFCFERLRSCTLTDDGSAVELALDDDADLPAATERIDTLARTMIDRHRTAERAIVFEHRVATRHRQAIWDPMVAHGLIHAEGPGQVTFAGEAARVALALDAHFARLAHDEFGAVDHQYPTMIEMDALDRCHYFTSFPHHVTFAPHIRTDLEVIAAFSSATGRSRDRLDRTVAAPQHVLSPAVCFHTYLYFADRPLDGPHTITACGRCFRHEGKNFQMAERLWDFSLREIVFVGPLGWGPTLVWMLGSKPPTIRSSSIILLPSDISNGCRRPSSNCNLACPILGNRWLQPRSTHT